MDRFVDLVRQLEPEMPPPSPDVRSRQREALVGSMAHAEETRTGRGHRQTRHRGWFVAVGTVAATAILAAILVPDASPPARRPAPTSAVLTAITRALATTGDDIEEVQVTVPGTPLATTSWVDVSTGGCRTDTSLDGRPSFTVSVEHGSAVVVDYGLRTWWTRDAGGVTCEPLTPQNIERDVHAGDYRVVGRATVDGQPSLKLVSTSSTSGLHPVTRLTTLWVNATTYLPIRSTSARHLGEQTTFAWLPATAANRANLEVSVPAGFQRVAAPPPELRTGGY